MTSTPGTVPSARSRFGAMRTIQPSTFGLGTDRPWYWIAFWPGSILIGPILKLSRCAPATGGGAVVAVVDGGVGAVVELDDLPAQPGNRINQSPATSAMRRGTRATVGWYSEGRRVSDQGRMNVSCSSNVP
jgi:hypothetical protein